MFGIALADHNTLLQLCKEPKSCNEDQVNLRKAVLSYCMLVIYISLICLRISRKR